MSTAERASERSVKALVLLAFMLGLREGEDQLSMGRLIGWTLVQAHVICWFLTAIRL